MRAAGAKAALILVLGTVFSILAGLLSFLVPLRTLQLVAQPIGPVQLLVLGAFASVVTSLYTSMCLRIELDLGVALPSAAVGAAVLAVVPASTVALGGLPSALFATSAANSLMGTVVTERFRGVGERFIATTHHAQTLLLLGAVAWSFSDLTVRWVLAVFGLMAWIGWQPSLLGSCALTLVEAKMDTARTKPELAERGFILYEMERRLGIRVPTASWDRFVYAVSLLLYSYWAVDLLT